MNEHSCQVLTGVFINEKSGLRASDIPLWVSLVVDVSEMKQEARRLTAIIGDKVDQMCTDLPQSVAACS